MLSGMTSGLVPECDWAIRNGLRANPKSAIPKRRSGFRETSGYLFRNGAFPGN
ncbi:UNVERIFIED_ORG: hypothetical protein BCL66_105299 [Martelella mediterranea]